MLLNPLQEVPKSIRTNFRGAHEKYSWRDTLTVSLVSVSKFRKFNLFTEILFTIFVPTTPPPPNHQNERTPLEFLLEGPSLRIANTQPKLRTNPPKTANKQNYEQTGVSESLSSGASRGAPHGVVNLKVRKGAFQALNKGSGALGKSEVKLSPPQGRPLMNSMSLAVFWFPMPFCISSLCAAD